MKIGKTERQILIVLSNNPNLDETSIRKIINRRSEIYGELKTLEDKNLIRSRLRNKIINGKYRPVKSYHLTEKGKSEIVQKNIYLEKEIRNIELETERMFDELGIGFTWGSASLLKNNPSTIDLDDGESSITFLKPEQLQWDENLHDKEFGKAVSLVNDRIQQNLAPEVPVIYLNIWNTERYKSVIDDVIEHFKGRNVQFAFEVFPETGGTVIADNYGRTKYEYMYSTAPSFTLKDPDDYYHAGTPMYKNLNDYY